MRTVCRSTRFLLSSYIRGGLLAAILLLVCSAYTQSYGQASLVVSPQSTQVAVAGTFTVEVKLQTGTQLVDGANIYLQYDPALLQVQSVTAGDALPVAISPVAFNNATGVISYAYGAFSGFPSGNILLFTATLKAVKGGTSGLNFVAVNGISTDVTYRGASILSGQTNGSVVVLGNSAPQAVADAYSTNEDTTLSVSAPGVGGNDTDEDNDALQVQLVGAPAHGEVVIRADGSFTYTPVVNFHGSDSFTYKVNDGEEDSNTATVSLMVQSVNDAPLLSNVPASISIDEHEPYTFTATATDADNPGQAQTLTFSLAPLSGGEVPAGATIDPSTGIFNWQPGEDQGGSSQGFKVVVSDGIASTEADIPTASVTEVNSAPVLSLATPPASITALMAFSLQASATDADLPQNTLTFSLLEAPAGATIDADGLIHWIPTAEQGNGNSYSFTVSVTDGSLSSLGSFSVVVNPAGNSAPVLEPIAEMQTGEMQTLRFKALATDADGDVLTFSIIDAPEGAKFYPTTGGFNWTPTEKQGLAVYAFKVAVTDGLHTVEQPVEITVDEVNRSPWLQAIGSKETKALALLSFTAIGKDADFPANTLSYSLEASATGAYPAGASIDAQTGYFSWTPTAEQTSATYSVKIVVSDGELRGEEEIQITVAGVNAAPVLAAIGDQNVNELVLLSFTASATDADTDAVLSYSLIDAPQGAKISATTGAFSWKPTEGQGPAVYAFKIRVSDGASYDEEEITVTVNEVNRRPAVAVIENATLDEGTNLSFTASATDMDLPANTLSYSLVGKVPQGASIHAQTGEFSWTPDETQGPASYTIRVRATDNGEPAMYADRAFSVTVNEVNAAPQLAAIAPVEIKALIPYSFRAVGRDEDFPANQLTYSLSGDVPSGAFIDAQTAEFSWTPTAEQSPGTYSFNVTVTDGLLFAEQPVKITVNGMNAAPELAYIEEQTTNEMRVLYFTASASDADAGAIVSYSLIGAPLGAKINEATGYFSWKPTEEQGPAVYNFIVRASDGILWDEQEVRVVVNEANKRPVLAFIDNMTVVALSTLTFTAQATDPDLPANSLSYSLMGTVPAGASVDAVTGVFSWTPTQAQAGVSYSFKLRVKDDGSPIMYMDRTFTVDVTAGAVISSKAGQRTVANSSLSEGMEAELSVYPNPTAGEVVISLGDVERQQEVSLQLIGMDGRVLMRGSGKLEALNRRLNEQLANAPAGMYVLRLMAEEQVYQLKLVKK